MEKEKIIKDVVELLIKESITIGEVEKVYLDRLCDGSLKVELETSNGQKS